MKLKKIDFSGLKSYLFQKGERLGMGICAGIALLLLGMGLMKAGGSSEPYAEELKSAWTNMKRQLDVPAPPLVEIKITEGDLPRPWPLNNVDFRSGPWVRIPDQGDDNKRQNPTVMKVQEDDKHLQVDFLRGGYFTYELEKEKVWVFEKSTPGGGDTATPGGLRPVQNMKPARFVVVTGVFPWKDQMDEFRKRLHYATMAELLAKPEDLPRPLGLNVYRCEVKPGGEGYTDWETIFKYDVNEDKLEVAQRIKDLFREAFIDVDNPAMLGKHVHPGLITPLPQLANLAYPKLKLQGITQDETMKPKKSQQPQQRNKLFGAGGGAKKGPPGSGATQQDVNTGLEPWTKFPMSLQDQFNGKIGFFEPTGANQDSQQANALSQGRAPNKEDKITLDDAVVRFIDVNVEPGKTYIYTFAVRMANPNFNKAKDVEFSSLATNKELLSEFTTTQPVTIPGEYFYYAAGDKVDVIPGGSNKEPATADYPTAYGKWNTPVQVHRWLSKFTEGKEWVVADWAIAERLLTRRGDPIGRYSVVTEVPVWEKTKEAFEIGSLPLNLKKRNYTGLPIHFIKDAHPPLLVDFEGGLRTNIKIAGVASPITKDESAVDMLILTPEGKLEVRNSRNDTDLDNPIALERHNRLENWLREIRKLRNAAGGNNMPGGQ